MSGNLLPLSHLQHWLRGSAGPGGDLGGLAWGCKMTPLSRRPQSDPRRSRGLGEGRRQSDPKSQTSLRISTGKLRPGVGPQRCLVHPRAEGGAPGLEKRAKTCRHSLDRLPGVDGCVLLSDLNGEDFQRQALGPSGQGRPLWGRQSPSVVTETAPHQAPSWPWQLLTLSWPQGAGTGNLGNPRLASEHPWSSLSPVFKIGGRAALEGGTSRLEMGR